MFGKHHTLAQLSSGIAVAVSLAVIAVPSAVATTSAPFITDTLGGNGSARALPDVVDRYIARHAEAQGTEAQGTAFITDTLGGNGSARALPDVVDRYIASHAKPQGTAFTTDTLGGNGHPAQPAGSYPDYVNAGMSAEVAQSNHRPSTHVVRAATARAYNSHAYVNGGASPTVATAIQDLGNGLAPTQSGTIVADSSGFSWNAALIGAGLVGGVVLLLLAGTRLRMHRRGSLTA